MLGEVGVNARVNPAAWPSARSQVEYEARIMDDNAPEAGCAQANAGEQKLDPGQQFSIHHADSLYVVPVMFYTAHQVR
jgi:hypothetical protein